MENKSKSSIIVIVILTILVVVLGGYIVYDKVLNKNTISSNNSTKENNNSVEKSNENVPSNSDKKALEGQFYLFEGFSTSRRYYLAYDNAEKIGEDNTFIDGRKREVYLVDMNVSSTNDFIKKIDFNNLIKDVYNDKINTLPSVLSPGTNNETKKTECKEYKIQYTTSDAYMFDGSKEIPFGIYYACIREDGAEISVGTEYYKLDVSTMKVTK